MYKVFSISVMKKGTECWSFLLFNVIYINQTFVLILYFDVVQVMVPMEQMASHQCSSGGGSGGWKCPCCDVVSPTASAAQRHMDSHSGVRAFRCTICRYKGNTLRGMRTHIRMHFEKRTTDLQVCKLIIIEPWSTYYSAEAWKLHAFYFLLNSNIINICSSSFSCIL